MSYHGRDILVKNNHPSQFSQQARKVIIQTVDLNKSKVDDVKVNTLTTDLKILLEEHNRIIKEYEDKFEFINKKFGELEERLAEKKADSAEEAILIIKEELKNLPQKIPSRPSSGTSSPKVLPKPELIRQPSKKPLKAQ